MRRGIFAGALPSREVAAPDVETLQALLDRIITRIFLCLERDGLLVRDPEQPWLDLETGLETEDALDSFGAASIQYRIVVGPDAGQKALTLKRAAAAAPSTAFVTKPFTVQRDGFSLPLYRGRGSVAFKAHQRERIEGLCRYITGPRADGRRLN